MRRSAVVALVAVSLAFSAGWLLRIAWTEFPEHRILMEPLGLIIVVLLALWVGRREER